MSLKNSYFGLKKRPLLIPSGGSIWFHTPQPGHSGPLAVSCGVHPRSVGGERCEWGNSYYNTASYRSSTVLLLVTHYLAAATLKKAVPARRPPIRSYSSSCTTSVACRVCVQKGSNPQKKTRAAVRVGTDEVSQEVILTTTVYSRSRSWCGTLLVKYVLVAS